MSVESNDGIIEGAELSSEDLGQVAGGFGIARL